MIDNTYGTSTSTIIYYKVRKFVWWKICVQHNHNIMNISFESKRSVVNIMTRAVIYNGDTVALRCERNVVI